MNNPLLSPFAELWNGPEADLSDEVHVTWIEDPHPLQCVRESLVVTPDHYSRPVLPEDIRLIGYSVLRPGSKHAPVHPRFIRRIFTYEDSFAEQLPPRDPGVYPLGSVDVATIKPGEYGLIPNICLPQGKWRFR